MLNIVKKDNSIKKEFDSYLIKINRKNKLNTHEYKLFDYESKIIEHLKKSTLLQNIINDEDKYKAVYISHHSTHIDPNIYYINVENSRFSTISILAIYKDELLNSFDLKTSYFNLFSYNSKHFYRNRNTNKKSVSHHLHLNVYQHKHKEKITYNIKKLANFIFRFNDLSLYSNRTQSLYFENTIYKDALDLDKHPIKIIEPPNEFNDYANIPFRIRYEHYNEKTHFFYDLDKNFLNKFNISNKHDFKNILTNFRLIRKYINKFGIKSSLHFGTFDEFKIIIQLEINGFKNTFAMPYNDNINELLNNKILFIEPDTFNEFIHDTEYSLSELIMHSKEIFEIESLKRY